MKNTIKKVMPMRLVTLVRCVKSHRAEGKMDMILGGLKDFQCQKWVYSHAKDEETAYLEQLEKICRKIEIDENNYFFYPYSKTLHRFFESIQRAFCQYSKQIGFYCHRSERRQTGH